MENLHSWTTAQLLGHFAELLDELKHRGVLRSNNNPTGDYAEWLFCRAFGLAQEPNVAPGWDAVAADGSRVQIKGRRRGPTQSVYRPLGFMRGLDAPVPPFDTLGAVVFEPGYEVALACIAPFDVVSEYAVFVPRVNGWRVRISQAFLEDKRVQLVTARLRAAAEETGT